VEEKVMDAVIAMNDCEIKNELVKKNDFLLPLSLLVEIQY